MSEPVCKVADDDATASIKGHVAAMQASAEETRRVAEELMRRLNLLQVAVADSLPFVMGGTLARLQTALEETVKPLPWSGSSGDLPNA